MTSPPSEQGLSVEKLKAQIVEIIGYQFGALVSGNRMPDMSGDPRNRLMPHVRRVFDQACAEAADEITALASRSSPDGWVLVPREPTPAMLQAACDKHAPGEPMKPGNHAPDSYYSECPRFKTRRKVWASMVSLAPTPAESGDGVASGQGNPAPAEPIPSPTSEPSAAGDP